MRIQIFGLILITSMSGSCQRGSSSSDGRDPTVGTVPVVAETSNTAVSVSAGDQLQIKVNNSSTTLIFVINGVRVTLLRIDPVTGIATLVLPESILAEILKGGSSSVTLNIAIYANEAEYAAGTLASQTAVKVQSAAAATATATPAPSSTATTVPSSGTLTVSSGTMALGFQPLQSTQDVTVTLGITSGATATITNTTFATTLAYKGGAYPGTSGTCGSAITASCTVVFTQTVSTITRYGSSAIVFDYYSVGVAKQLSIAATGSTYNLLGQPDVATKTANAGGTVEANTLSFPRFMAVAGSKLFLVDYSNNRVLVWNELPTSTLRTPADFAIGQPNLTTGTANTGGISGTRLSSPAGVAAYGSNLAITDQSNQRVLLWTTIPTNETTAPNRVLGQSNFTNNTRNGGNGGVMTRQGMFNPNGVAIDGSHFVVTEWYNCRVLIWNGIPATDFAAADSIIGVATGAAASGLSGTRFDSPMGVTLSNGDLYVADQGQYRILQWNGTPASDDTAAVLALGQSNLISGGWSGTDDSVTLNYPTGVYAYGTKIFAGEHWGNRILVWNSKPTSFRQPADSTFNTPYLDLETGSTSNYRFNKPEGVLVTGAIMFVAEAANHRVWVVPAP